MIQKCCNGLSPSLDRWESSKKEKMESMECFKKSPDRLETNISKHMKVPFKKTALDYGLGTWKGPQLSVRITGKKPINSMQF